MGPGKIRVIRVFRGPVLRFQKKIDMAVMRFILEAN
jgi:hypothetical protein